MENKAFEYLNTKGVTISIVENNLLPTGKWFIDKENRVAYLPEDGSIYKIIFGMNTESFEKNLDYAIDYALNKVKRHIKNYKG